MKVYSLKQTFVLVMSLLLDSMNRDGACRMKSDSYMCCSSSLRVALFLRTSSIWRNSSLYLQYHSWSLNLLRKRLKQSDFDSHQAHRMILNFLYNHRKKTYQQSSYSPDLRGLIPWSASKTTQTSESLHFSRSFCLIMASLRSTSNVRKMLSNLYCGNWLAKR